MPTERNALATVTIKFTDVGPAKKSWTDTIPVPTDGPINNAAMVRSIKKHNALGSRDIMFGNDGGIYVGMFRRVGTWGVELPEATHATR